MARRGFPSVVYSDNAKTFIKTANELTKLFNHLAPQWRFIAPRAPWWGGQWERLVRSVKSSLKKSLGLSLVTKKEMETCLCDVELCVNSRPLIYVEAESNDFETLTPAHFLLGRDATSKINIDFEDLSVSKTDLLQRDTDVDLMYKRFWSIWSKDYITNLPSIIPKFKQKCNLKIGSVVVIKEDNTPRLHWPLGLVTEIHQSSDGLVRSVTLKTAKGIIKRPIQNLYDLEVSHLDDVSIVDCNQVKIGLDNYDDSVKLDDFSNKDMNDLRTRFGRTVKPPERYGI